jgi:hypothetical protein
VASSPNSISTKIDGSTNLYLPCHTRHFCRRCRNTDLHTLLLYVQKPALPCNSRHHQAWELFRRVEDIDAGLAVKLNGDLFLFYPEIRHPHSRIPWGVLLSMRGKTGPCSRPITTPYLACYGPGASFPVSKTG